MKKTVKKVAKKLAKKSNPSFYTRIGKNLERSETGLYRVRKNIDGEPTIEIFTRMRDAKNYLKNLA